MNSKKNRESQRRLASIAWGIVCVHCFAVGFLPFLHNHVDVGSDSYVQIEKTVHLHGPTLSKTGHVCQTHDFPHHLLTCIACQWGQTNNARFGNGYYTVVPHDPAVYFLREIPQVYGLSHTLGKSPRAPPLFS